MQVPGTPTVRIEDPVLGPIRDKVLSGERLGFEDGVALFASADLAGLGSLANAVREATNGTAAYYVINRHINYSNVCTDTCLFCAFARRKGQPGGYEMSLEAVYAKAADAEARGISELHIVGGLHPDLPYGYYHDMVAGLRARHPSIGIKAFTAVEIDHLAGLAGMTVETVLADLKACGLTAMPGGGAEIFAERARKAICRTKMDADSWMRVQRVAHRLGIPTNGTMLYGHVETLEERVDHLVRIRALQDETGGLMAFIPLAFHPENTFMGHLPGPTPHDHLRTIAVSRLLLDNVPHIKCYWILSGLETARRSLDFGADDIDGTVIEEKIYHMAGARTPQETTRQELTSLIVAAGRVPVERDTLYRPIVRTAPARDS